MLFLNREDSAQFLMWFIYDSMVLTKHVFSMLPSYTSIFSKIDIESVFCVSLFNVLLYNMHVGLSKFLPLSMTEIAKIEIWLLLKIL